MRGKKMATATASTNNSELDTTRLLQILVSVKRGDFSVRLPTGWTGISGKIADTLNDIVDMMEENTKQIEWLSHVVGKEGKLSQRASTPAGGGSWKVRIDA